MGSGVLFYSASGRWTMKVLPSPIRLSTVTEPPWSPAVPRRAAEPSERPGSVPARPPLVPALIAALRDAAGTMVYICGFVVFFLVLLRVLGRVTGLSHPVLSGAVELTQGILALPHTRRGFVWAAGLLGWGGLSVHGQSAAVLSGTDLPMGPYLAAKAAHAAVSVLLAWPVSMCL